MTPSASLTGGEPRPPADVPVVGPADPHARRVVSWKEKHPCEVPATMIGFVGLKRDRRIGLLIEFPGGLFNRGVAARWRGEISKQNLTT